MDTKKVISGHLFFDRWVYDKPSLDVNSDGDIVAVSQKSFGPLEVYEWGISSDGTVYEKYQWCEDDWYSDSNYKKEIDKEKLLEKIMTMKELIRDTTLVNEWDEIYNKIVSML